MYKQKNEDTRIERERYGGRERQREKKRYRVGEGERNRERPDFTIVVPWLTNLWQFRFTFFNFFLSGHYF